MDVSSDAAALIADACSKREGDGGFRVFVRSDDTENTRLRIKYAPAPEANDTIVERDDARVFVAQDVVSMVDEYVLDVRNDEGNHRLVLRRGVAAER